MISEGELSSWLRTRASLAPKNGESSSPCEGLVFWGNEINNNKDREFGCLERTLERSSSPEPHVTDFESFPLVSARGRERTIHDEQIQAETDSAETLKMGLEPPSVASPIRSQSDSNAKQRDNSELWKGINPSVCCKEEESAKLEALSTAKPRDSNAIKERKNSEPKTTDPSKCYIEVESKLEALSIVKLSVYPTNGGKRPRMQSRDVMKVSISTDDDVKDLHVTKTEEKFEVVFTPKVPGLFTADLQLNGEPISNSPLELDIKPQALKITGEFKMSEPLKHPRAMAVNASGTTIAITDYTSHCVAVYNMDGELLRKIGEEDIRNKSGRISWETCPSDLAFISDDLIAVSCVSSSMITIFDTRSGETLKTFHTDGSWGIGVDCDQDGYIIVSDSHNHRVQVFNNQGAYLYQFDLEVMGDNVHTSGSVSHGKHFILSDLKNHVVRVYNQIGITAAKGVVIGRQGFVDGELSHPMDITVNHDGYVLVCDRGNHRVQKFTLDGRFVAKTIEYIGEPTSLAALSDGRVIVRDDETERIFYIE